MRILLGSCALDGEYHININENSILVYFCWRRALWMLHELGYICRKRMSHYYAGLISCVPIWLYFVDNSSTGLQKFGYFQFGTTFIHVLICAIKIWDRYLW